MKQTPVNKSEQTRYLVDKITRSGSIHNLSRFLECVELDTSDFGYVDEQARKLGYALDMAEVEQLHAWRKGHKIRACSCGHNHEPRIFPLRDPQPATSPQTAPAEAPQESKIRACSSQEHLPLCRKSTPYPQPQTTPQTAPSENKYVRYFVALSSQKTA